MLTTCLKWYLFGTTSGILRHTDDMPHVVLVRYHLRHTDDMPHVVLDRYHLRHTDDMSHVVLVRYHLRHTDNMPQVVLHEGSLTTCLKWYLIGTT